MVGLGTPSRRRTRGLRREDVAALAAMSIDYYRRLEQGRIGPPSPQILDAIARALRLTPDEHDYLYRIAARAPAPRRAARTAVSPGLLQVVQSLGDSPAMVLTTMGETLAQNPASVALHGDHSGYVGDARFNTYRWFSDPGVRWMHPPEEHAEESAARVADLRARAAEADSAKADRLIGLLRARSAEFARLWLDQKVAVCRAGTKTMLNPRFGRADLDCQILRHEGEGQLLVAFTAAPGSHAATQLARLTATDGGGRRADRPASP